MQTEYPRVDPPLSSRPLPNLFKQRQRKWGRDTPKGFPLVSDPEPEKEMRREEGRKEGTKGGDEGKKERKKKEEKRKRRFTPTNLPPESLHNHRTDRMDRTERTDRTDRTIRWTGLTAHLKKR
jgi:hypothetical protein